MRLLITGINWPPETFLRRLIDGLVRAGVEVTVGCARRPEKEANVKWLRTPSWDASLPVRMARLLAMAARAIVRGSSDLKLLSRGLYGERFEKAPNSQPKENRATLLLHSVGQWLWIWNQLLPYAGRRWDIIYYPWNSAAIACLPVFDLGTPVVVSCRGTQVSVAPHNPERAGIREGLKTTFSKATAVHCVSEATLKDACQLGLGRAKSRVIRPAVDPERFRPLAFAPAKNGTFSVVTVGTLIWVKGYEWALQAIRRLADKGIDVQFDIIGDGPERQRVLYTIADLGLENRVRWLGRLAPDEVLVRVQRADAFLLSSLSEGISNAALEAMACGIPIVTTDCGGMPEAVTDEVEGLVVPIRNSEAIANALLRLAADESLRGRIGRAARERVEKEFALKLQISYWLDHVLNKQVEDRVPGWDVGTASKHRCA
jgi:colanic acid/amylovoran biosynthesis glycosyltransferase